MPSGLYITSNEPWRQSPQLSKVSMPPTFTTVRDEHTTPSPRPPQYLEFRFVTTSLMQESQCNAAFCLWICLRNQLDLCIRLKAFNLVRDGFSVSCILYRNAGMVFKWYTSHFHPYWISDYSVLVALCGWNKMQ